MMLLPVIICLFTSRTLEACKSDAASRDPCSKNPILSAFLGEESIEYSPQIRLSLLTPRNQIQCRKHMHDDTILALRVHATSPKLIMQVSILCNHIAKKKCVYFIFLF